MFSEVDHEGLGRFLTAGSPLRFGAAPPAIARPAPALGEHTEQVIREFGL